MRRYGAAELFGRAIHSLSRDDLKRLSSANHKDEACPFKAGGAVCHKKGGVCSLRLYEKSADQRISIVGEPVTTCPTRFLEDRTVFHWVHKILLGGADLKEVREVAFLMSDQEGGISKKVGRIDNVLLTEEDGKLTWCALEMQAVYFSGGQMGSDLKLMGKEKGIPFPSKHRRPDFRSSGPKRLMPQLQIKVPTLRRWGKKMAVVIDKAFWESLGPVPVVPHLSNADIVWFVVSYANGANGRFKLQADHAYYTTLEDAVTGLTGGTPVSLEEFERSIRQKLGRGEAK